MPVSNQRLRFFGRLVLRHIPFEKTRMWETFLFPVKFGRLMYLFSCTGLWMLVTCGVRDSHEVFFTNCILGANFYQHFSSSIRIKAEFIEEQHQFNCVSSICMAANKHTKFCRSHQYKNVVWNLDLQFYGVDNTGAQHLCTILKWATIIWNNVKRIS